MVGNIIGIFAALFLGVAAYFAYASKGEYTTDKEAELAAQKERDAEMNVRLEEEKSNLETIRQEIVEKKEILDPIGDPETLISEVRETRASIFILNSNLTLLLIHRLLMSMEV